LIVSFEILAQWVFSPLKWTYAMSQGFEPVAGDATGVRCQPLTSSLVSRKQQMEETQLVEILDS
jgi:hypothetical protein